MNRVKVAGIIVAALVVVIVIAQNTDEVRTKVLWMEAVMPRAVLLIVTLLVGFGLGVLFGGRLRRKL